MDKRITAKSGLIAQRQLKAFEAKEKPVSNLPPPPPEKPPAPPVLTPPETATLTPEERLNTFPDEDLREQAELILGEDYDPEWDRGEVIAAILKSMKK